MHSQHIHHDLEGMTMVALYQAKEHSCNYNIIISCPLEGKFNLRHGSTYEMVADSYFNKPRPNAVLLARTDDMVAQGCETMAEYLELSKQNP